MKRLFPSLPLPLLLSLGLNAILVGAVLMGQHRGGGAQPPVAMPVVTAVQPKAAPPSQPAAKAKPFQWSQLEAPDFATYVKNLRAIGCPELTIHDIVAGELKEIYAQKGQEISTATNGRLREAEMMKLQYEHDQLLTHLTAPPVSPIQASALAASSDTQSGGSSTATTVPTNAASISPQNPVADIPAAFSYGTTGATVAQEGNQDVLTAATPDQSLSPAATTALKQMQSDFVEALGDSIHNPESPNYRRSWNMARRDSDERFSSMFGGDAFIRTQIQAAHAAAAAK